MKTKEHETTDKKIEEISDEYSESKDERRIIEGELENLSQLQNIKENEKERRTREMG